MKVGPRSSQATDQKVWGSNPYGRAKRLIPANYHYLSSQNIRALPALLSRQFFGPKYLIAKTDIERFLSATAPFPMYQSEKFCPYANPPGGSVFSASLELQKYFSDLTKAETNHQIHHTETQLQLLRRQKNKQHQLVRYLLYPFQSSYQS